MFRTSRVGRFINQNLFSVVLATIVIAFIIIIVQILNNVEKNKYINNNQDTESNVVVEEIYTAQDTVISGDTVSKEDNQVNIEIIDNFIELCNNQNIQEAYNLLSNECKEIYFPTLNIFENNYFSKVFSSKKTYSAQSWINNDKYTYKIKIFEDMLSTGIYNNSNVIEDYYTIIETEEGTKLSINGYIGREQVSYTKEDYGINVEVLYKDVYKDYEIYKFKIKNKSSNTILMDSKENTKSTYLVGSNDTIYSSYMYEVDLQTLIIESGKEKEVKIKFNKQYNPERNTNGVVFSNIILNYNEYLNTENKQDYTNRAKIQLY